MAPKAVGNAVRDEFVQQRGVPCMVAVHTDASGLSLPKAIAHAQAINNQKAPIIPTTFREETEADLFSEQAVLCGGLSQLILTAFDVMQEGGFSPEIAYFECLHELKFIVDLLHKKGLSGMVQKISEAAAYGIKASHNPSYKQQMKTHMQHLLQNIQSKSFTRDFLQKMNPSSQQKPSNTPHPQQIPWKQQEILTLQQHLLETTGKSLRQQMPK